MGQGRRDRAALHRAGPPGDGAEPRRPGCDPVLPGDGQGPRAPQGLSVGDAAVSGRVCLIEHARDIDRFVEGSILVTGTTDPDWVPIMKKAAAIITDHGGRTSHAAIVSRELGLPAIVGTGTATHVLHDEQEVTVDCAGGEEGEITAGAATIEVEALDLSHIPDTRTGVMLNLANPAAALRWWRLPAAGVGLARMEFVVNSAVRIHPMALVHFDDLADAAAKEQIEALTAGYTDKSQYFVDTLAAASRASRRCTTRTRSSSG
jgi:pyruvate, water dikinase